MVRLVDSSRRGALGVPGPRKGVGDLCVVSHCWWPVTCIGDWRDVAGRAAAGWGSASVGGAKEFGCGEAEAGLAVGTTKGRAVLAEAAPDSRADSVGGAAFVEVAVNWSAE